MCTWGLFSRFLLSYRPAPVEDWLGIWTRLDGRWGGLGGPVQRLDQPGGYGVGTARPIALYLVNGA
jgi:hypothetical protein